MKEEELDYFVLEGAVGLISGILAFKIAMQIIQIPISDWGIAEVILCLIFAFPLMFTIQKIKEFFLNENK